MNDDAKAWGEFWALQSSGAAEGQSSGGCLPQRWEAIESGQRNAWNDFAKELAPAPRILDLATGDGRVLGWLNDALEGADLLGVDLAPVLPTPPAGVETKGGIAMESLPFDDDAFDAVVSQFGFEYGEVDAVAAEISRVLAPGGSVGIMVHRGDGPILEHNRARQAEIVWVRDDKRAFEAVGAALDADGAGPPIAAQVAQVLATLGQSQFGRSSPAWEIPEAIRRACLMGADAGVGSIKETIEAIRNQADNEIGRIESLARACARADDRAAILDAFAAGGLELASSQAITEPSGREFADFITFK